MDDENFVGVNNDQLSEIRTPSFDNNSDEISLLLDGDKHDYSNLIDQQPRKPVRMPKASVFILAVEFCERLCYYGASLVFMTYMIDMLGFSNQTANAFSNAFSFWAYFSPLLGGYMADSVWGKFKTIFWFGVVYLIGMISLSISACPFSWKNFPYTAGIADFGTIGFLFGLFAIGLGTGGIKANVSTMVADQLGNCTSEDIERVFRWFYWSINAGALLGQGVSPSLHNYGPTKDDTSGKPMGTSFYWSFMFPSCGFVIGLIIFIIGKQHYVVRPPVGSLITKSFGVFRSAWNNRRNQAPNNQRGNDEGFLFRADLNVYQRSFVADLSKALDACKVFLLFPFYWLLYNQMQSNFISQGMWMNRPSWLAAEQLNLVDSIIIVCLIPVFDSLIFPGIRRVFNARLACVARMATGFVIAGLGFVYAGFLQRAISNRGYWDSAQDYHVYPGHTMVSVWLQIPPYIFIAISEIFSSISALEFAYAQAPKTMKSVVMSLFLLTSAGGSLLGLLMSALFIPQNFEVIFYSFSVGMVILAVVFWRFFKHYDDDLEEEME